MDNDLQSNRLTATGTVYGARARVKAIYIASSATAGTIEFKDGGASGTSKFILDSPAGAAEHVEVTLPGGGVLFKTDVHATLTNVTGVTVFWA